MQWKLSNTRCASTSQLVLMKLVLVLVVVMVLFDGISGTAITTQVLLMKLLHSIADTADFSTSTANDS